MPGMNHSKLSGFRTMAFNFGICSNSFHELTGIFKNTNLNNTHDYWVYLVSSTMTPDFF